MDNEFLAAKEARIKVFHDIILAIAAERELDATEIFDAVAMAVVDIARFYEKNGGSSADDVVADFKKGLDHYSKRENYRDIWDEEDKEDGDDAAVSSGDCSNTARPGRVGSVLVNVNKGLWLISVKDIVPKYKGA